MKKGFPIIGGVVGGSIGAFLGGFIVNTLPFVQEIDRTITLVILAFIGFGIGAWIENKIRK